MNKITCFFAFAIIGVAYAFPTVDLANQKYPLQIKANEDSLHEEQIPVLQKDELVSKSDISGEKTSNVKETPALTKDEINAEIIDENLKPAENRYGGWGPGFGGWGPGFGGWGPQFVVFGGPGYGWGRGFGRHGWRRHGWRGYW